MVPGTLSSDGRTTETGNSTHSSFHRFALSYHCMPFRCPTDIFVIYIYITVTTVTQSGEDWSCKLSISFHNHGEGPYWALPLIESAY